MGTHCGVATMSRLLQIIGLFCKRALLKRQYSAKETYNFKEPINRSHPIDRSLDRSIDRQVDRYGVATVSRIDKILGHFCKRDL